MIDQERFFRETGVSKRPTVLYFDGFINDRIQVDAINRLVAPR
jgi:hypothetical protein